jgi:MFS transporter, SP family, general alpha glucoside:H+ symporter
MMEHTNALEKAVSAGVSYKDCFKKTDLRRTEIVCCTWAVQTLCGSTFMGYSTYFYEQAGLATANAFTMSMAQFALGAIGTISSWVLMGWFGRRTLYLTGQLAMTALLLVIGFLGITSRDNTGAQWAIGSMLLLYTFTYDATVRELVPNFPICSFEFGRALLTLLN